MADAVTIQAQVRDPRKNKGTGSRVARRLRAQGRIPAIIYGHKQAPQPVSLARDDVWLMIKRSTHLAQLSLGGGSNETVLVRDVQWDHLGKEIIHLDFARVSADEAIHTTVPLELHGTAPGVGEGGVLTQVIHSIAVTCRANAIPDQIRLEVGDLHLGQGLHARDLKLPEGLTVSVDPELLLVHVVNPTAEADAAPVEGTSTQPELIGRKAEDKDGDEKGK